MTIIDKIKDLLRMLVENIHKRRKVVLALSCVVVFVTTYMLILPAFTLEKTKAAEQGGIDVPGVTATAEDVSEEDADANDGQADAQDVQTESGKTEDGKVEDSGSKSKDSGEAKSDSAQTADSLTYEDEHYTIAVDDKNSVLPENTEIKVEEIDKAKDEKEYQKHFDDALAAIQEEKDGENVSDLEFARFYDISLVSDGKEVTLGNGDKVSVNIEYDKELRKALGVENKDNIRIIHFAENKDTGKVEAEVLDNKDAKVTAETTEDNLLKEAAFDAESFSVYGLVYVKEAEEDAAEDKAADEAEKKEESKEEVNDENVEDSAETEGSSSINLGNAVVSTVDGSELPNNVDGHADIVAGKKAIKSVEKSIDNLDTDNTSYEVFDIALDNVKESDYSEGFKVNVSLPENVKGKDFRLFHIHDGKVEELTLSKDSVSSNKYGVEEVSGFTFETDGFSQFVLAYTVDFTYEIDGQVYKYHLDGGNSIKLSDLIDALNVVDNTGFKTTKELISAVANVEFSDPTLVKVTHKKPLIGVFSSEDWVLESLKAFTSEETLTITFTDGEVLTIKVTDAQYTNDLNTLLTGVTVKIDGKDVKPGDKITVDKGEKFDMHLEMTENDFFQFVDDDTEMVYQLPDGISLGDESFTKYITVNMGLDGNVYRNPVTYDPATNTLRFKWNTNDPNFDKLTGTDNTKVSFDLSGQFDENATHVDFGMGLEVDVEHKEHHDADIQKDGQLFLPGAEGNPYGNQPAIMYTVTVTSDGANTVNVRDTVEGSAVTLDTTNWRAESNKDTSITPTFTGNGFTLNNQSLQDGEVVKITYWGKVDTSKIDNLRNATYEETGNKVTVSGDEIPEKEDKHYEHEVSANKMSKSSTGVSEVDENGKQTVTWKIVANNNPLESIGGSTITDRISYNSLGYMSYSGPGINVVAKRANGTVAWNQNYAWDSDNLTTVETDYDKHWVFTVPDTSDALTYEITYTTEVDTKKFSGLTSVVNTTEGKPGESSGSATVGVPEGQTTQPVNYTKAAVDVSQDEIVWNISVNIDKADSGYYNEFNLTEYIPKHTFGDIGYIDDFESVEVIGLEGSEWYEIEQVKDYLKPDGTSNDNAYGKTGDYKKPTQIVLHFYRDGKQGDDVQNQNEQNSKTNPGINATGNRTLTVRVVTKNSKGWLDLAAKEGITHQDYLTHTNEAKINNWDKVSATASPMEKVVYKMRDGKIAETGPNGNESAYKAVDTPGKNQGVIKNNEQVKYPAYKFWVIVGGVTKNNLNENNQIVIEDTFDPHFRLMMDNEFGKKTQYGYGSSPTSFNARTPDSASGESFSWTQENGKATFVITNPKKNGDNYYPYYMVEYWLVPKSDEDYQAIKRLTMEENGKKLFENTASSDSESAELKFEYDYKVIDKTSESDNSGPIPLEKYTIKINPDKFKLNNGNSMTMTDTFSDNLSVDFGSITVTAVGKNGEDRSSDVTWDYRGRQGTFTIPDETYVVIKYNARVVGDLGSIQTVSNTAYMEGYYDTVEKTHVVDMSGEGSAERVRIRLLKFAPGHMEGGLEGAVFRLLDQDMKPVLDKDGNEITYTTGTGYLSKYGIVHAGTDLLDYTFNNETGKYDTGVYSSDLSETGLQRWNAGIIENPTTNASKIVTYDDLSEAGRKRLGVNIHDGFAEVILDQKKLGVALKKERTYYLEEIQAPEGYEKTFVKYSFLITDQSDYSAPGGVYVYHNNDVVTVRNQPEESTTFKISKTFTGNASLTDEQKNRVTFQIQKKNGEAWEDYTVPIWDEENNRKVDASHFTYGSYGVKASESGSSQEYVKGDLLFKDGVFTIENMPRGIYRVIETNQSMSSETGTEYSRSTEYLVDGTKETPNNEAEGVIVEANDGKSHDVAITNSYFTNKYDIKKVSSDTAEVLGNAEFKIVKVTGKDTGEDVKTGLKTNNNGELSIQFNGNSWGAGFTFEKDTLYYVVETKAPEGYITPSDPEKNYFYFSSEGSSYTPDPEWLNGESAVDLSTGFGSATIPNKRDVQKTYVKVDKKWINSIGKDITNTMTEAEKVDVTLCRTTDKLTSGTVITNGESKDASELKKVTIKNGDSTVSAFYFLQGDKIQVSANGTGLTDANLAVNPQCSVTEITKKASFASWTVDLTNNNDTVISVSDASTATITAVNITGANRLYRINKSDAESISKDSSFNRTATLSPSSEWTHTFSNLDLTDESGNPYFYYIVEDGAKNDTSYEIGSKSIIVTNTAPDQLEVNKKWEDVNGESVNNEKTDGSITYELYQVENPLAVGPYSGTGNYSVNIEGLNTDGAWNHVKLELKGHVDRIKEGSKVKLEITASNASNQTLDGEISISGGTVISDTNDLIDIDMGGWTAKYHKRTIIIDNVSGNIVLNGTITTDTKLDLVSTVLEEPTNAQTDWESLEKRKMGDILVTHNDATLTKTPAFENANFRVTPGTKAWSSLIYNLPTEGVLEGKRVTYKYHVVEKNTPVGTNYNEPSYLVNGETVENAVGEPGDTIVIINKEKENPKGALKLTKQVTVNGSSTDTTKADGEYSFNITGPGNETTVNKTVVIKVERGVATGYKIDNESSFTPFPAGNQFVLIPDLDAGTYTVTEIEPTNGTKISKINGNASTAYFTNVTVVAGDTEAAEASVTFTNEYTPTDFEFTKLWKNADGTDATNWPEGKSIVVNLHRRIGNTIDSNFNPSYTISKNDLVNGKEIAASGEGYPTVVVVDATTFKFKVSDLDSFGKIGENAGTYTYYADETKIDDYNDPSYVNPATTEGQTITSQTEVLDNGTIVNRPVESYELPHTGGIGTVIFYVLGSILVIGGGIYFISRRRAMK